MRKIPPLNSVRAFEAVARHQSFSAAADELSVTVAAVSHQIRQLEAGLGHKLLERGRQVSLTPIGRTLYPSLRDGFDQIASAFALLGAARQEQSLQVSSTRAFAERWLMPRLARFHAAYPAIMVNIHASEKIVDLRAQAIDLAIRYGPLNAEDRASVLFEDEFIAVADAGICPAGRTPCIDDFHPRALLAFKWKNQQLDAPTWSGWLNRVEHDPARDFRISWYSEETLALHAAEQGLGPLLCSSVLVADALRVGRMRRIEGPALPGFAYRLVDSSVAPCKSLMLFKAWLIEEAKAAATPGIRAQTVMPTRA